jgi:hypothetical protein
MGRIMSVGRVPREKRAGPKTAQSTDARKTARFAGNSPIFKKDSVWHHLRSRESVAVVLAAIGGRKVA